MGNIRKAFCEANEITEKQYCQRMDELFIYFRERMFNETEKSCNTSHVKNGQEKYCSSEDK